MPVPIYTHASKRLGAYFFELLTRLGSLYTAALIDETWLALHCCAVLRFALPRGAMEIRIYNENRIYDTCY